MTTLLGTLIGITITLVALGLAKWVKNGRTTKKVLEPLTDKEMNEMLKMYAGQDVPFHMTEEVYGQMTNFDVDWLMVHGMRYVDFEAAIGSRKLTDEEFAMLEELEETLATLKKEKVNAKRFLQVKDMLDGKVYSYEPCKMQLDVDTGAARVALELVRNEDLSMMIQTIYVSKTDVSVAANRYEFDMLNVDDVESLELLVRNNDAFEMEVLQLELIESRIAHFNSLVTKERIGMDSKGNVVVYPPSPAEIKALHRPARPVETTQEVQQEIEEFINVSQL